MARASGVTAALLAVLTLYGEAASGCGAKPSCRSEEIDRFFLPLIAASMRKEQLAAGQRLPPPMSPAATSPLWSEFIRPPPAPHAPGPVRPHIMLHHELVTGDLAEGGRTSLYFEDFETAAEAASRDHPVNRRPPIGLPPLRRSAALSPVWRMHHVASLPEVPSWPLQGLALPVEMHLTCGACGAGGGIRDFRGTAHLELVFDDDILGWINDIDLRAGDGMMASGFLRFADRHTGQQVIEDHLAEMFLRIGGRDTHFQGSLLSWMTDRMRVQGAISMGPVDRPDGVGAIAGHFSGVSCTADCGVEN